MERALAAVMPALPRPYRGSVKACLAALVLTAFSSLFVVAGGPWIRLLVALTVAMLLVIITLSRPVLGITMTFVYLVFVAFLRRLLIPVAGGWISADPMLLVAPLVAIMLLVKLFILDRRPWAPDLISKLVLVILVITFAEVPNPGSGGIAAGIAGLMFMAVPLLWFFVGRELLRGPETDKLLGLVVVLGTIVALYGLWQTQIGDPPWDNNWLNVTGGYASLRVGNQVRAFGTFSSSSEYALFVGGSLAIALAFCLRGRLIAAIPIPLLAVALFLSSARGALATAAFAIIVMLGLITRRPVTALVVTVAAIGLAAVGLKLASSSLSSQSGAASALVSHEINGVTDPLNPDSSTLLLHVQLVIQGVKSSLHHVVGQGTAVTNGAAGVNPNAASSVTQATEVDISNAFVALGPVGGVLYAFLVLMVLFRAVQGFFRGYSSLLPIIALLISGLGQWLIGGDYALSSLSWLLIGAVAATQPRFQNAAARGSRRRSAITSSAVSSA